MYQYFMNLILYMSLHLLIPFPVLSVPDQISLLVTTSFIPLYLQVCFCFICVILSDMGLAHPPFSALRTIWSSENDCSWAVYHRNYLENGRMASLQEQMALHTWHNFLRQTRTRTVNTGFACCSHPHQNITMKTRYFCGKGIGDFKLHSFRCYGLLCVPYNMAELLTFFIKQNFVYNGLFVFIFLFIPINLPG